MTQGVAEVLPVSSSAHLALLPWWRGWPAEPGRTTLAAGLHAGSCAGIAWALRADVRRLAGSPAGRRTLALAAATSIPAAVAGRLVDDAVEQHLGRPRPMAVLLAAGGAAMALADRGAARRTAGGPVEIGVVDAAVAGVAQVAALVPGVSRGAATLTALRLRGVPLPVAARFSLLMSLPVTAGAAALTLRRADRRLLATVVPALTVGAPAAAVAAAVTVNRVSGRRLGLVALYRLVVAAAVWSRVRTAGTRGGDA